MALNGIQGGSKLRFKVFITVQCINKTQAVLHSQSFRSVHNNARAVNKAIFSRLRRISPLILQIEEYTEIVGLNFLASL